MLRSKLGLKIIFIVLAAVIITTGSVGYLTFHFSELFLEETAVERYAELTSETMHHIDTYIFERERSVQLLADSHTPKHFLTEIMLEGDSPAHPVGGVIEDLDSFGMNSTIWSSVSLVDRNAIIQASSRVESVGVKFDGISTEQFEKVLEGKPYATDFELFQNQEYLNKLYVIPVKRFGDYEGDKEFVGALVAYLPFSAIEELALELKHQIPEYLQTVAGVALLSGDGYILFTDGITDYIEGKNKSDYVNTYVESKRHGDDTKTYILTSSNGIEREVCMFEQESGFNGIISGFGGSLSFELGTENISQPIFNISIKPALYVIPIALIVGLILFLLLYLIIIKPIRAYIKTIEEIRKGNTKARAKSFSNDEIGQMAQNFNELTDQLQNSNEALEQQVQKRTKELEIANTSLEQRVAERTGQLQSLKDSLEETVLNRTKELNNKISELEMINRLMVDRELKMVSLKEDLNDCRSGK